MVILLLPLVAAILLFVDAPPKYTPRPAPNALQERLYGRLSAAGLEGDELATVGALTLGYKEELSKELKQHFQVSGAAHVLAVSGLHTGIIYAMIIGLLTLGGRIRPMHENRLGRRALGIVVIAAMWGYAWLTGMTPSVVRAVVMMTIFEAGYMTYRRAFSLNTIATAAFVILIVRPDDLWSVSFQLSFAATAAIVLILNKVIYRESELTRNRNSVLGKTVSFVGGMIAVSLAAQIGTLPITIHYFGQVSTYFLLTNLIILPVATVLVPCGLVSIALGGSHIGVLFSHFTYGLAWLMNHATGWIEHLPGSSLPAHADRGMVVVYYILLSLFLLFLPKKST